MRSKSWYSSLMPLTSANLSEYLLSESAAMRTMVSRPRELNRMMKLRAMTASSLGTMALCTVSYTDFFSLEIASITRAWARSLFSVNVVRYFLSCSMVLPSVEVKTTITSLQLMPLSSSPRVNRLSRASCS